MARPSIAITLADPTRSHDPASARIKNDLYLEAIERAGGEPVALDETAREADVAGAMERTHGLLITGGSDLDPALYGALPAGSVGVRRARDRLDLAAWRGASFRDLPVLGICRGLQAINVFMGGRLAQHVEGHQGPGFGEGDPVMHAFTVAPGSRLARILDGGRDGRDGGDGDEGATWTVNSFHHQAVRATDLAPGLVAAGFAADGDQGTLVEALETDDGRWVVGVQFHPERVDSTPAAFERLFAAFVEAARGTAARGIRAAPPRRSAAGTAGSAPLEGG